MSSNDWVRQLHVRLAIGSLTCYRPLYTEYWICYARLWLDCRPKPNSANKSGDTDDAKPCALHISNCVQQMHDRHVRVWGHDGQYTLWYIWNLAGPPTVNVVRRRFKCWRVAERTQVKEPQERGIPEGQPCWRAAHFKLEGGCLLQLRAGNDHLCIAMYWPG